MPEAAAACPMFIDSMVAGSSIGRSLNPPMMGRSSQMREPAGRSSRALGPGLKKAPGIVRAPDCLLVLRSLAFRFILGGAGARSRIAARCAAGTRRGAAGAGTGARARLVASVLRCRRVLLGRELADRKSTRLNSSHQIISYAVFCLKKKT